MRSASSVEHFWSEGAWIAPIVEVAGNHCSTSPKDWWMPWVGKGASFLMKHHKVSGCFVLPHSAMFWSNTCAAILPDCVCGQLCMVRQGKLWNPYTKAVSWASCQWSEAQRRCKSTARTAWWCQNVASTVRKYSQFISTVEILTSQIWGGGVLSHEWLESAWKSFRAENLGQTLPESSAERCFLVAMPPQEWRYCDFSLICCSSLPRLRTSHTHS